MSERQLKEMKVDEYELLQKEEGTLILQIVPKPKVYNVEGKFKNGVLHVERLVESIEDDS